MSEEFLKAARKRKNKTEEIPEEDIEDHFVKHAKKLGCEALKLILLRLRGWPDRTVLCPGGRVLFIEFKKKGKPLSPTQKPWKRLIQSFGFDYLICDEIGQAEKALEDFLSGELL